MSNIYDLLNDQPDLQKLIKYYYYMSLIPEQRWYNYKSVVAKLDSAFTNCREHMRVMLGGSDAYNEISLIRVFNDFYGEDWVRCKLMGGKLTQI